MGQGLDSMPWTVGRHLCFLDCKTGELKGFQQGVLSAAIQRMGWERVPPGSVSEVATVRSRMRHLSAISCSGSGAWSPILGVPGGLLKVGNPHPRV